MTSQLAGYHVLLVEAPPAGGLFAEALLAALGCVVVGPVDDLDVAYRMGISAPIDAALLDSRIGSEALSILCNILTSRRVPFVVAGGNSDVRLPEKWRDCPLLPKPYNMAELREALIRATTR